MKTYKFACILRVPDALQKYVSRGYSTVRHGWITVIEFTAEPSAVDDSGWYGTHYDFTLEGKNYRFLAGLDGTYTVEVK